MTETPEQIQWRQHMGELRRAAHGLGGDFDLYFRSLDDRIARFSSRTSKDLRGDMRDIESDIAALGRRIDREMVALPGNVKTKVVAGAAAVGSGAARIGGATRDVMEAAGSRAREGTKNALASAAGVNRKPMKEWGSSEGSAAVERGQ